MPDVFDRLYTALKANGVLYASFKKGVGERRFTDVDEAYLRSILTDRFDIIEIRESIDVRPGRENEVWMNVLARRKD